MSGWVAALLLIALWAPLRAPLSAQSPQAAPMAAAAAPVPAPEPAPSTSSAPAPGPARQVEDGQAPGLPEPQMAPAPDAALKKIIWATAAGTAAGALIGTRALSFDPLSGSVRTAHEWRAGLVYGAIGGVLSAALTTRLLEGPEPDAPHRFFLDRWNTPLLAGMITVHVLDFTSTRYFRDRGKSEWLLTNAVVDHRPAFVATEAAAAAAGIGLIYLFHRSGHHRLERWIEAGYISLGTASAIANYRYPHTGHGLFGN